MNKKMTMILGGAAVGAALLLAPTAGADPATPTPPTPYTGWGGQVSSCNASSCYTTGPTRGSYVGGPTGQAQNSNTPGYGAEIHTLVKPGGGGPGNSNPSNLGGPNK